LFAEETLIRNDDSIEQIREKYWIKNRHPHVGGIELTPYCNLRCVHCYLQDQEKQTLMTTEEVMGIIDKICDAGVLFLYFTGGEIFTRPDFLEIYVYAKQKGFIVELLTNGTLITQEAIEIFNRLPPASISISMYGKDEESYYRVTGQRGMYNKVINTFNLLSQNEIHFEIKYIGMKENQDDYLAIHSLAESYGAEFSYSMELFPTLNGNSCTKNHMIPLEKIIEMESQMPGKKDEYKRLSEIPNSYIDRDDVPLYLCDMAISNFLIDYQGYLNPCHKCRFKKWNLLSDDFKTAWDDYLSLLKERASKNNKCLKCKYLLMCSPCVVVNYLSTGDYNTPSETVCRLTHMRVEMCNSLD
jgi:radical SAM protein with 4Fe4S-binding SPASM domain